MVTGPRRSSKKVFVELEDDFEDETYLSEDDTDSDENSDDERISPFKRSRRTRHNLNFMDDEKPYERVKSPVRSALRSPVRRSRLFEPEIEPQFMRSPVRSVAPVRSVSPVRLVAPVRSVAPRSRLFEPEIEPQNMRSPAYQSIFDNDDVALAEHIQLVPFKSSVNRFTPTKDLPVFAPQMRSIPYANRSIYPMNQIRSDAGKSPVRTIVQRSRLFEPDIEPQNMRFPAYQSSVNPTKDLFTFVPETLSRSYANRSFNPSYATSAKFAPAVGMTCGQCFDELLKARITNPSELLTSDKCRDFFTKCPDKVEELRRRVAEVQRMNQNTPEYKSLIKRTQDEIITELRETKKQILADTSEIKRIQTFKNEIMSELQSITGQQGGCKEQIDLLRQEIRDRSATGNNCADLTTKNAELLKTIQEMKAQIVVLEDIKIRCDEAQMREVGNVKQLADFKERLATLEAQKEALEKEFGQDKVNQSMMADKMRQHESELKAHKQKCDACEQEKEALRARYEQEMETLKRQQRDAATQVSIALEEEREPSKAQVSLTLNEAGESSGGEAQQIQQVEETIGNLETKTKEIKEQIKENQEKVKSLNGLMLQFSPQLGAKLIKRYEDEQRGTLRERLSDNPDFCRGVDENTTLPQFDTYKSYDDNKDEYVRIKFCQEEQAKRKLSESSVNSGATFDTSDDSFQTIGVTTENTSDMNLSFRDDESSNDNMINATQSGTEPTFVRELNDEWHIYKTPDDGIEFYYNVKTGESTWNEPEETFYDAVSEEKDGGICGLRRQRRVGTCALKPRVPQRADY